jgi:peptidoglycan hydrolase-like protein with peptidoglycan-binding domain
MNRTLTAAVALAAGLGLAGLAHAQSSAGPSTTPNTVSPSTSSAQMNAPSSAQSPNAMQNPGAMSNPSSSYGTQGPQASTQQNQSGQQNASQSEIQQAQQQLKQQGLYNGSIDGIVGPETQTALMKFQREQGLPETAQLDQQTMGRLMNGSSGGAQDNTNGAAQSPGAQYPAGTPNPGTTNTNR